MSKGLPPRPHVAYVDERYMYTDDDGVDHFTDPRDVMCGDWSTLEGGTVICDDCMWWYEREYPQGWRSYPGDVCRHGTYVGGSGIDWMCMPCELGDDDE